MVRGFGRRVRPMLAVAPLVMFACPLSAKAQTVAAASAQPRLAVPSPTPLERRAAPLPGVEAVPRTRFVIGLEGPAKFQVFALSNPDRVVIELPDMKMQLPPLKEHSAKGLVKSYRAGVAAPGKTRIVLDLAEPVVIEKSGIEPVKGGGGHRLALEILPLRASIAKGRKVASQGPDPGLATADVQPPVPKPATRKQTKADRVFKPTIVIDPGHGGHDSGAKKNGAVEKEVVLAFSKALQEKLLASGRYRVLMTRENDTFVGLDERRAFGERHGANLFIAVHADYAGRNARGATVYQLRDGVANSLKSSAKSAVTSKVLTGSEEEAVKKINNGSAGEVKGILGELVAREVDATKERTGVVTRSLIQSLGATTTLRDDPDQKAAFRVLKTAQFPSVLLELAYVTNKQDAQNLKSDKWRAEVASSIVHAIDDYFGHELARLPM